jgi:hypothetical protein
MKKVGAGARNAQKSTGPATLEQTASVPGPQEAFPPIGKKYTAIWRVCTANSPFSKILLYFRYFWYFPYTK